MFKKLKDLKLFQNSKFRIQNFLASGLYLLIFLLPFQTHLVLRAGEWHGKFGGNWPVDYWRISLYAVDIVLVGLLAMAVFQLKIKEEESRKRNLWIWFCVGALDLALFLSIFLAQDKALAVYKYLSFLLGVGLFWLLSLDFYDRAKATLVFLSSVALQGFLSVGQFFFQGSFACKWLGMASHTAADGGASVVETIGADGKLERWLRSYGSFDHPNILGGFLAIGLVVCFHRLLRHRRPLGKGTDWKSLILDFSFVISLSGLLFTFSRSALLAAAVGIVSLIAWHLFVRDRRSIVRSLKLSAVAVFVVAAMTFSYANVFLTRTSHQARLEVKSVAERRLYLQDSLSLFKQSRYLGVGIGNYTKALERMAPERFFWQWQPVHNVFLLILVEGGPLALVGWCGLFLGLFYLSWRKKDILSLSISLSLGIMMILDHYLWSLHSGLLMFFLLAGIIMRNLQENKEHDIQSA
jgi:hypothetical protein